LLGGFAGFVQGQDSKTEQGTAADADMPRR